jgi:rSAM/selenodomain-associated transferase 2
MTIQFPQISVIIPVLNEEDYIKKVLLSIKNNTSSNQVKEILVVDGGSEDATVKEALNAGARVISTSKGRALQMNVGAAIATGDILYFLHVDTLPPKNFDVEILNAYTEGFKVGCFRMKFDSTNPFLDVFAWFTRINTQLCRGGDQSLFILKSLFEKANGFDESYRVYEDNEFIKRIYKMTAFKVLSNTVTTSSRRYDKKGVLTLQWHFGMIHLKHFFGAGPENLHRYYVKHIAI